MEHADTKNSGTLTVCVRESFDPQRSLRFGARVDVYRRREGISEEMPPAGTAESKRQAKSAAPEPVWDHHDTGKTRIRDGCCHFTGLPPGTYHAIARIGRCVSLKSRDVSITTNECDNTVTCQINTGLRISTWIVGRNDCTPMECAQINKGKSFRAVLEYRAELGDVSVDFVASGAQRLGDPVEVTVETAQDDAGASAKDAKASTRQIAQLFKADVAGTYPLEARITAADDTEAVASIPFTQGEDTQQIAGDISVTMRRTAPELTDDLALWVVIRNSNNALSFNNYATFMDQLFCGRTPPLDPPPFTVVRGERVSPFHTLAERRFLPYTDSDAYRLLKVATEAFVMVNCGVLKRDYGFSPEDAQYVLRKVGLAPELKDFWRRYLQSVNGFDNPVLPYLALVRRKLSEFSIKTRLFDDPQRLPPEQFEECWGILQSKLTAPCLMELIWSYWHEEGMLVQTLNAVTRRFQNVRVSVPGLDPLANFEVDPLRPLNNLLWAYTQDEQHRLSVVRRNYEYDHEYGLRLEGRAVNSPRPADTRSKFLEAFHHLLNVASQFYKQDDNTTIVADGFPVLNALKEVHLILSEGAHNQFGDLPSTARIEMLMQQWLLARPEFREFLPTRVMVAYPEAWMDRVDAMKRLQGWSDTNVLNFRNLGVFGEQLLLTIRYGNWSDVHDAAQGANWARFWRPEVQGYVHAYRAVSGVDLSQIAGDARVDATLPSTLLRRRLAEQQQRQRP